IYELSKIDRWFLSNIEEIVSFEKKLKRFKNKEIPYEVMKEAKEMGFSDRQIAKLVNSTEEKIRKLRKKMGIEADYKLVDTCAGEFEAFTPYYYSTYEKAEIIKV
ncbi:carbamoyl-phosphate synthase subunit L, partial [bacterium]|nr:carbamoyl-phosphate synthase subunit L [bacterium]